jgi:hypothetical protein
MALELWKTCYPQVELLAANPDVSRHNVLSFVHTTMVFVTILRIPVLKTERDTIMSLLHERPGHRRIAYYRRGAATTDREGFL